MELRCGFTELRNDYETILPYGEPLNKTVWLGLRKCVTCINKWNIFSALKECQGKTKQKTNSKNYSNCGWRL